MQQPKSRPIEGIYGFYKASLAAERSGKARELWSVARSMAANMGVSRFVCDVWRLKQRALNWYAYVSNSSIV